VLELGGERADADDGQSSRPESGERYADDRRRAG
jgi:hypothetical protein